ncbi:MAG TPA: hypothetical protein VFY93_17570, partial [Planctomycetota bacterium]|nr:hypothetical protein [Planctomycetota bacterium]
CYYFAGEEPDLVDGIVAHAGNFFKAKLDKGAREKVAIGILHGRADAVVTVQCAFTTFLTYREGGYEHVKLMVVDGLNEQSGHWPLPWHVPRMLAWCDRTAAKSPASAAEAALEELAQEEPDLAAVARAAALGTKLLEKAPPEEARAAADRLDAVRKLLDAAKASFSKALLQGADAESGANGPWAAKLRIAVAAFDEDWLEGTPGLRKAVARDTKAIDEALKGLAKGSKKSYARALETAKKAFLGAGYDDLLLQLGRWDKPGDAVDAKDLDAYRALAGDLKRFADDGRREATRLWAPELRAFEADRADWLAPYRERE